MAPERSAAQRPQEPELDKELKKRIEHSFFVGSKNAVWGRISRRHPDRFQIHFTPQTPWQKITRKLASFIDPTGINLPQITGPKKAETPKEYFSFLSDGRSDVLELIDKLKNDKRYESVREIHGVTNYRMARFAMKHLGFQVWVDPRDTRTAEDILAAAREEAKGAKGQEALDKGILHIYLPKEQLFEFANEDKQREFDEYLESIRERAGIKPPSKLTRFFLDVFFNTKQIK